MSSSDNNNNNLFKKKKVKRKPTYLPDGPIERESFWYQNEDKPNYFNTKGSQRTFIIEILREKYGIPIELDVTRSWIYNNWTYGVNMYVKRDGTKEHRVFKALRGHEPDMQIREKETKQQQQQKILPLNDIKNAKNVTETITPKPDLSKPFTIASDLTPTTPTVSTTNQQFSSVTQKQNTTPKTNSETNNERFRIMSTVDGMIESFRRVIELAERQIIQNNITIEGSNRTIATLERQKQLLLQPRKPNNTQGEAHYQ